MKVYWPDCRQDTDVPKGGHKLHGTGTLPLTGTDTMLTPLRAWQLAQCVEKGLCPYRQGPREEKASAAQNHLGTCFTKNWLPCGLCMEPPDGLLV